MPVISSYINKLRRLLSPTLPFSLSPPHSFPLSLLLSLILTLNINAQEPSNCNQRLTDAESLFQTGIFEDIPDVLEDCLDTYEPQDKLRALKLLVLSRYMNDDITGAEETIQRLLKEFPLFRPEQDDPVDFQYLFNTFQVKRLFSIGLFAGTETAWGVIKEPWSPFKDKFSYVPGFPGYIIGAQINIHITKYLVINTQPSLSSYKFRLHYDNPINGILDLKQQEQQTLLEFPVYFRFEFLKSRIKPYIKAGGTVGLLLSAHTKSNLERYDPNSDEIIFSSGDIKNEITEFRNNPLFFVGGAAGMNIDLNKNRLFVELNYDHCFNQMLKKDVNRFDEESLWTEGWFDSDFRLNRTAIKVGFVKSFYTVRKHKQN